MKAIQVEHPGGFEVLELKDLAPVGKPGPGQAAVRIMCAGVNFTDTYQRRGIVPRELPFIPGVEGAGVVESVGRAVTNVKPGDRVAFTWQWQPGCYAEETLAQADRLIPLPDDFSFEQGAAFPLQGITAHYLMHEFRPPKAADVVLIHAAAGGMGLLLVQWALHLGARVIGTVSTEAKAKSVREAGASDVILYTQQDFAAETQKLTNGHGADLIIDGVGKSTFSGNLEAAAVRGHIVIYGMASGPADPIVPNALMTRALSLSGGMLPIFIATAEQTQRRAKDVVRAIQEGWLKLRIDQVLPLARVSEAHRLLETRQTMGKLVLSTQA